MKKTLNMKTKILTAVYLSVSILLAFSCKNSTTNNNKDKKNVIQELPMHEETATLDSLIYYRFPSPKEVFDYIDKSKIDYNNAILNPSENVKKYLELPVQAINLGIYISDLAYITLFEQHQESLEYFNAIHQLSEKIKISGAYDEPLYKRISNNLDNVDSLLVISGEAYQNIVDHLTETDQENMLAVISIGAYIESLYLIMDYIQEYDAESELLSKVLDQKYAVNNLYEYAAQFKDDKILDEALDNLKAIKSVFDKLEVNTPEKTSVDTENDMMVISGGDELSITREQFMELKETVVESRESLVKK